MKFEEDYVPRYQKLYDLQPHRVQEILLVSSLYDAFVLEEDRDLTEHHHQETPDAKKRQTQV